MRHPDKRPRIEFSFDGEFLGFVSHDGKLKYMRLRVLSEEIQIKIPKALRRAGGLSVQPGASIRVAGISKLNRHTHHLKLKATQILPITAPAAITTSATVSPSTSTLNKAKFKPRIKVLVCQKSGCLKRGGKGLCEALEQTLRDRNLEQKVTIQRSGCLKRCSSAPNLVLMPGNQRYTDVHPRLLPQIADAIAQRVAPT